jgi:predicted acetyltransferase
LFTVPYGDPLAFAFEDPAGARRGADLSHPIGTLTAGPMVRIIDIPRALAARGYCGDGDVTLACIDGESSESVRLVVRGGRAEVLDASGPPDAEIDRATLGTVIAAGLSAGDAAELGLLRANPATVARIEQLFSGPRFQCLDPF